MGAAACGDALKRWLEKLCRQMGAQVVYPNHDIMGHRIAVYAEFEMVGHEDVKVAFEAGNCAGNVGKDEVAEFGKVVRDLRAKGGCHVGIVVARKRFNLKAYERAREDGLRLVTRADLTFRTRMGPSSKALAWLLGEGGRSARSGMPFGQYSAAKQVQQETSKTQRRPRPGAKTAQGSKSKEGVFVAGRLCLFGEHSDWAADYGVQRGRCLVVGTEQGLSARGSRSNHFRVEQEIVCGGRPAGMRMRLCEWEPEALYLGATDPKEYFRFCVGVAHEVCRQQLVPGGIDLRITGADLPIGKGVASSAAVCVLVAKAFDKVYSLGWSTKRIMDLAYQGERIAGSLCGRMDQACIFLSRIPVLLTFGVSGDTEAEPLCPDRTIYMFFVDLGGRKNTVKILQDLHRAYIKCRPLQQALGATNERIVEAAKRALLDGDAEQLGCLMCEAQAVFDKLVARHSPEELASPLLHKVLTCPEIQSHIYGGKGVGSQGDGSAQFVARGASQRDVAMATVERLFPGTRCFPLIIQGRESPV